jgi:YidC/Oxa1 family membrane protein insertase
VIDRRTLLAIVLSALVLILVPLLLERLGLTPRRVRPPAPELADTSAAPAPERAAPGPHLAEREPGAPAPRQPPTRRDAARAAFPSLLAAADREATARTDLYAARFRSRGADLIAVELFGFHSSEDGNVELAGTPTAHVDMGGAGELELLAEVPFEIAESTDASGALRKLRFIAADSLGLRIVETWTFHPGSYLMDLDIEMQGALARGYQQYRLLLRTWPLITEHNVQEDVRSLQAVSKVGQELRRDSHSDLQKKGMRTHEGAIAWVAVRSKYFTVAAVPVEASAMRSAAWAEHLEPPPAGASGAWHGQQVAGALVLPVPPDGTRHRFRVYAGPNDYWILEKAGHGLHEVVDLGWRWLLPFSRAILKVMVFLKQYIPNFGLVIIALAGLVRLVFHPLNHASMKSMRAMQRLQPEIEKVRKRLEKDPQKMNQAIMELYREHKVNPLGGCLPLLVQMPVLIALYQVFYHAIDLRQASFFLWINDLSSPDELFTVLGFPIRLLPLVMFLSTWMQQGLQPSDARQKTTMILMNVFMLVIFYNLPSGLVLYWTVTNLLTAAQMYLIHRGDLRQQSKPA